VELGGGLQSWWNDFGGTNPVITANVGIPISEKWLGFIDRFYAGYGAVLTSGTTTHELKLGLGMRF
jgi:hypothetical protein